MTDPARSPPSNARHRRAKLGPVKVPQVGDMVGAWRFELQTSCAQGNCKKSISLVRLALFCVMVLGFGPNLSAFGPKWTQVFSRN